MCFFCCPNSAVLARCLAAPSGRKLDVWVDGVRRFRVTVELEPEEEEGNGAGGCGNTEGPVIEAHPSVLLE